MSAEEKQLLADQVKLIERTRKASHVAEELSQLCDNAGLPILSREWAHIAKTLGMQIDLQVRALKSDLPEGFPNDR